MAEGTVGPEGLGREELGLQVFPVDGGLRGGRHCTSHKPRVGRLHQERGEEREGEVPEGRTPSVMELTRLLSGLN